MVKGKKKPKVPFWKKLDPELQSIATHIGKMTDNMKLNDWADLGIIAGLAYLSYDVTQDLRGALIGPIGYKLATTMGGTPPLSQIAGLTILAALGMASFREAGSEGASLRLGEYEFPLGFPFMPRGPYVSAARR